MDSRKTSLISRHIVLFHHRHPLYGIILIEDELIKDVVPADPSVPVSELSSQYNNWNPVSLEDFYISPGLIDCNVRVNGEWEGYRCLTKAALAGGVTMLMEEPSIYELKCRESELYCDVAKAFLATNSSIPQLEAALEDGAFAVKGFLSAPSAYVESVDAVLPELLQRLGELKIPLLLDTCYPNQRHMYMGSPCHHQSLEQRAAFDGKSDLNYFAGAFPEDDGTPDGDSDSSEDTPQEPFTRARSDLTDIKKARIKELIGKRSITKPKYSIETIPEETKNRGPEAKTVTLRKQKKRRASLPKLDNIYEDLDKRIKQTEGNIEDLAFEEYKGYNAAGRTLYEEEPLRKRSSSFATCTLLTTGSQFFDKSPQLFEESPTRGEGGGFQERLRDIRPMALNLGKPQKAKEDESEEKDGRDRSYTRHLANFPDKWEQTGIDFLVDFIKDSQCHVHLCNMASANAVNKVRHLQMKTVTCETCPHYLYFTSNSVPDGLTSLKTFPPIRSKANNNFLWELLKMKSIDIIASNHTPVAPMFKFADSGSFRKAVNGVTGIGFTLQAVWTKLLQSSPTAELRDHYIVRLSKWLSLHPAKLLGVSHIRGSIDKGKSADLIVWKPMESETVMSSFSLHSNHCPYVGHQLYGKIHKVYLRGVVVYEKGTLLAKGRRLYRNQI